jgi:Domain of Unknown Function (DUF1080)
MRLKLLTILLLKIYFSTAQSSVYDLTNLPLSDLIGFKNPSNNWQIVGNITAGFQDEILKTQLGKGVLFNKMDKKDLYKPNQELFTAFEHGDIYLELDFMMPKGSNSGIYLQGRYEVQLFDSWGVKNPKQVDCGGIYQRWNDATQTGYEGHAPRVNASFAPGLWQHLVIDFQAPRFDAAGKKTQNALMKKVILNGITIHENVLLTGSTRAAAFSDEKSKGALMIQGDHGQVAFRNIKYALLGEFSVPITELNYDYYEGHTTGISDVKPAELTRKGSAKNIDFNLADNVNKMCIVFNGKINITESGDYQWLILRNGRAKLDIDGKEVIKDTWKLVGEDSLIKTYLSAGEHTFTLAYMKDFTWRPSALGLYLLKPNFKPFPLHATASLPDPIPEPFIEVGVKQTPQLHRSYFEHGGKKKTHVISVGDPQGIHFAYDLNQAGLLNIWKGGFLNATDMWFERGEPQTSKPIGATVNFFGRCPIALVLDKNDALPDTLDPQKELILKGYTLDETRHPTFKFTYNGVNFTENFQNTEGGKNFQRLIKATNNSNKKLLYRLAEGELISDLGNGLYAIDNQKFYLQIDPDSKPFIRDNKGKKELVVEKNEKESEVKCTYIF